LSAYHLAEQTTGIHKMTFELIDTNNNIHYLTQTFSVFNEGERPVTPDSYRRNQYSSTTTTTTVPVTYNTSANSYTETANHIQATAVNELAETTRALTQQLAEQIGLQQFLEIVQQAQVQLISSKQQVKPLLKLRERLQNQSQIQIQLVSKLWLLQLLF